MLVADILETMHHVNRLLPVLLILVIINTASGVARSIIKEGHVFDMKKFYQGIVVAVIAICAIYALAYATDVLGVESLGFSPITILTIGIISYAAKVGTNLIKLLGLSDYIEIKTLEKLEKEKIVTPTVEEEVIVSPVEEPTPVSYVDDNNYTPPLC